MASLRNTRSMEKYLAGWNSPVPSRQILASRYSMRADTAVVCVRSRFFAASLVFQYDSYLAQIRYRLQSCSAPLNNQFDGRMAHTLL